MARVNEISGDLIKFAQDGAFDIILHGCNCFCKMGSGVAKAVSEAYPLALHADLETKVGDYTKLGNYTVVPSKANKKSANKIIYIINCYIQYNYGRAKKQYVDYDALRLCLRKVNFRYPNKHIGMPRIGAGLGGGDWNIIKQIIEEELKDMKVTIVKL